MNQLHLDERARIREAMDRLLTGQATASNEASQSSPSPPRPTSIAWPSSNGTST